MAIYNAGYLSPFKNKLGNAVGRKWRTLDVISVYNGTPRNPNTAAQKLVRTRMSAISKLAAPASTIIKAGFAAVCEGTKVPPRAKFIKENWARVQASAPGTVVISFADLKFSDGGLPVPDMTAPNFGEPLEISSDINDNADTPGADANDIIYMFCIEQESRAMMVADTVTRSDSKATITLTQWWNGRSVHVYAFAVGDGNNNKGVTSQTVYLGTGEVA